MNKVLCTAMFSLLFVVSGIGQTKNFIDQPYIEVGGYADTMLTPNLIYIKIIIAEKDSRDRISLEEQESKMIAAFRAMGLKPKQT